MKNNTNEMTSAELLAAIAYSDLADYEVVIKLNGRYVIGCLNSIDIKYENGDMSPTFGIRGFVRSRN